MLPLRTFVRRSPSIRSEDRRGSGSPETALQRMNCKPSACAISTVVSSNSPYGGLNSNPRSIPLLEREDRPADLGALVVRVQRRQVGVDLPVRSDLKEGDGQERLDLGIVFCDPPA